MRTLGRIASTRYSRPYACMKRSVLSTILLGLLACCFLASGCSRLTVIRVTNDYSFPIRVEVTAQTKAVMETETLPPHTTAICGRYFRPRALMITVSRLNDAGEAQVLSQDGFSGELLHSGDMHLIAAEKKLVIHNDAQDFWLYAIGIAGCIVTVLRWWKQRSARQV
jgi:hypothetical protein